MSNRLSGKVCIVTGTAGGIGREAALTFAREGALVVDCGLYLDEAEATLAVSASETMRIGLSNFLEEYLSGIAGVRCGSLFLPGCESRCTLPAADRRSKRVVRIGNDAELSELR
jgi:NAD(P)-dependent dehydrogenase (short-subunit alcohol dehydrogenase family)